MEDSTLSNIVNYFITECHTISYNRLNDVVINLDNYLSIIAAASDDISSTLTILLSCLDLLMNIPDICVDTTAQCETLQATLPILVKEFGATITPKTVTFDIDDVILSDDEDEYDFGGYTVTLYNYPIDMKHLHTKEYYTIVPKDHNKAYANGKAVYPHPHINEAVLCEGEAAIGIRNALKAGDLVSFLLLVNSVVNTYNPDGAYKLLDYWAHCRDDIECSDCGIIINTDDAYICDECGSYLCDECRYSCEACDNTYCHNCISQCKDCGKLMCKYCLEDHMQACLCSVCNSYTCRNCTHSCSHCGINVCTQCATCITPIDNNVRIKYYCPECTKTLGSEDI